LTSNLPFARWGNVFGDQVVAAAMIDRIVHADVLTLKGSRNRLNDTGIDTTQTSTDLACVASTAGNHPRRP
jgi:DNA replication protein DnaC